LPASALQGDGGSSVTIVSPLRYAIVWEVYVDYPQVKPIETADGPVPALGQPFPVSLLMPPVAVARDLASDEQITIANRSQRASFPRIVVYEDVDQSDSFTPGPPDGTAGDRVLGIVYQTSEIAALLDLESMLKAMPLGSASDYYAASGGRFTPFVAVGDGAYAIVWQPQLTLVLDGWSYPGLPAGCRRLSAVAEARSRTYWIDAAADTTCAETAFGPSVAACAVMALQGLPAPALAPVQTLELRRTVRCEADGDMQVLRVTESEPSATSTGGASVYTPAGVCTQSISVHESVYLASASDLPTWWPCGTVIPF
jgi:hypothetical protein